MDINLNWKGGLLLAIFLYLNSTLAQAQPILVGAEYGGQVPIEGVWEFPGCFQDEEYGDYDYKEYLIFTGDQVEGRVVQYTSTDESCSGVETIIESDTGTVFPGGLQTEGTCWDDEPPQRQDSTGPLAANPAASWLIFWLGEGEAEAGLYYIDDTAETWYLWRGAGGDENGNGDNGNGEENGGGPYEPEEPPCPFPLKAEEPLMKLTPATITVTVDIKPGSDPNSVNLRSNGVIPVAVLGSMDFDAAQIDVSSVTFGPSGAVPVHGGHSEDVNMDGFMDMVFHFHTAETGIACGDSEATLAGETYAGSPIAGSDSVKTVGCK